MTLPSLSEIAQKNPIALFYFFSEDCAPCLSLREKLKETLPRHYPDVPFYLIDGKKMPELMQEHMILSFPTLMLWADGREYRRYGVYTSISTIMEDLERIKSLME